MECSRVEMLKKFSAVILPLDYMLLYLDTHCGR